MGKPVPMVLGAGSAIAGLVLLNAAGVWPTAPSLVILPSVLIGPRPLLAVALPVLLFWVWSAQLFRGSGSVPEHAFFGLLALSLLTAYWFVSYWTPGVRALGLVCVVAYATVNTLSLSLLWLLGAHAATKESFRINLSFHLAAAAWLVTVAFPDFGGWP